MYLETERPTRVRASQGETLFYMAIPYYADDKQVVPDCVYVIIVDVNRNVDPHSYCNSARQVRTGVRP